MFTQPTVSNEDMRYYQFKARQLFLLRRENHEWNEFCKRNACTCCSCQTTAQPRATKEIAVQASPKKPLASHARNTKSVTSNQTVMQALNEVKTKLEQIDLALSGRTREQNVNERFSEVNFPSSNVPVQFLQDPDREKRIQLIQSSLKQSLQRLQVSGQWKNNTRPPINIKKKNSGYFLPHELQKQRAVARNAYLASLTKLKSHPPTSSSCVRKEKNPNKQTKVPQKTQKLKGVSKTRKESCLKLIAKEKEVQTSITSNELTEVKKPSSIVEQRSEEASAEACLREGIPGEISSQSPLLSNWAKIQQNLTRIKTPSELDGKTSEVDHPNEPKHKTDEEIATSTSSSEVHAGLNKKPGAEMPALSQPSSLFLKKDLVIDPETVQEISKHRREYFQYLERVSRKKTSNFDPCTLANMISESLLNECMEEIAKELQDVPGFLVTDLYDEEFLQTV